TDSADGAVGSSQAGKTAAIAAGGQAHPTGYGRTGGGESAHTSRCKTVDIFTAAGASGQSTAATAAEAGHPCATAATEGGCAATAAAKGGSTAAASTSAESGAAAAASACAGRGRVTARACGVPARQDRRRGQRPSHLQVGLS